MSMENGHRDDSLVALRTLQRAAVDAHRRAAFYGLKIPVTGENGELIYLDPNSIEHDPEIVAELEELERARIECKLRNMRGE